MLHIDGEKHSRSGNTAGLDSVARVEIEFRNPFLSALGGRVRALRARRGMTRKALALAAPVSERHLANLEHGTGNASIMVLVNVAAALQCSLADLLGDVTTSSSEWRLIREALERCDDVALRRVRIAIGAILGIRGQSDPTLSQFLTLRGGNPDLLPERANTLTFGIVYSPTQTLSASVDYYRIGQRDVVDANAQFVLNQNARFGRFADRVQRDAQGNLLEVQASPINIGRREVSGWDVGLHYSFESTPIGVFDVAINASYINSFQDQLNPDTRTRQQAGTFSDEASSGNGSLPHWKASVGLQWQQSAWNGRYSIYYVGPLREQVPESERVRRIDAWANHNLQISYVASGPGTKLWRTDAASTELEVALGVENLFDAEPPFAASAFNDNFDGRTYSLAGRYVYLRVSAETH